MLHLWTLPYYFNVLCASKIYDPKNIGKAKEAGECENNFRGFDWGIRLVSIFQLRFKHQLMEYFFNSSIVLFKGIEALHILSFQNSA